MEYISNDAWAFLALASAAACFIIAGRLMNRKGTSLR
jgi:hypothetical protein